MYDSVLWTGYGLAMMCAANINGRLFHTWISSFSLSLFCCVAVWIVTLLSGPFRVGVECIWLKPYFYSIWALCYFLSWYLKLIWMLFGVWCCFFVVWYDSIFVVWCQPAGSSFASSRFGQAHCFYGSIEPVAFLCHLNDGWNLCIFTIQLKFCNWFGCVLIARSENNNDHNFFVEFFLLPCLLFISSISLASCLLAHIDFSPSESDSSFIELACIDNGKSSIEYILNHAK